MPFVSKSQRRACYAKNDPNWNCEEWEQKTPKKLPEKKMKENFAMKSFHDWMLVKEVSEQQIYDHAKEWLLELDFEDDFESRQDYVKHIKGLTNPQIKRTIETHYDGGWKAFVRTEGN